MGRIEYDLNSLLLGIYLKKTKTRTQKDLCSHMFIIALFTLAKTWKQPKWLSMDTWIKKTWNILYNGMLFSDEQKDIFPFMTM